ncbi:MAG: T9SS type A sorting domain-containing protein [Ignavibacteriaceae bacterium]|nr:T9SS type A sorting domain-containing protein [Ignavibacteriaceae bacterium]
MKKLIYVSFLILLTGLTFAQPKDILVNWECNMEIEILSGRFTPGDTVAARGDFNGWGRYDLVPNPIDPNFYVSENPITITNASVGDTIIKGYKFFYTPNSWEGGDNRIYILTQSDYDAGEATVSRAFNDGTLQTVTNQPTEVLFTVDCNNAVSAINNQPFPVVNTVHIAGGTPPLQWPDLGWPDNQIDRMIPMFDDGTNGDETAGDKIFSGIVTFPAYTIFQIQYKYGINYGDAVNNGGGNDNENAIGANHVIELFALAWSCRVDNVFGTMGNHTFTTDVNDVPGSVPTAYALDQNFPNPFNPSTKINYSLPVEGFVTLDVYNSIGQKVATLVNETKTAGNYTVNFDASDLTSGIYFYKINAGSFTETKKMILLK